MLLLIMSSLILNFMTQNDRDFQKVLQALTVFDKKISVLENTIKELAEANVNYASSQQDLNKSQAELSKELGEGIKQLAINLSTVVEYLQKKEVN